MKRLLIVDDEPSVRFGLRSYLETEGFEVCEAGSCKEASDQVQRRPVSAVLLDVRLPDGSGIELLRQMRLKDPALPILVVTGHATVPMAVEAMRMGADHFLTKPVDMKELEVLLTKAMSMGTMRRENRVLRERPAPRAPFLGTSAAMGRLEPLLRAATAHLSPLLLTGETGTGKGMIARLIHDRSPNREEPFVELNCAGLKHEFLETELFGHVKGAFTGAADKKEGLIARAHRGTLFLDEIGDMDPAVQAKFLKAVEEKRFRPLGAVEEVHSDFRLICATLQDLEKRIRDGAFRRDLYYRINTLVVPLPPLRDRLEDLDGLVRHMLREIAPAREVPEVGPEVLDLLGSYSWPGNLRELHNVLERAWILSEGGPLRPDHFAGLGVGAAGEAVAAAPAGLSLKDAERSHLVSVLRRTGGDVPKAAALLGVSRATLYRKLCYHGLKADDSRRRAVGEGAGLS